MAKRIMRAFRMTEISGVDRPAQKGARAAIIKRDSTDPWNDAAYEKLCKRTFTADERREAEANGHAMPGGRYPIESRADLENAIHAVGRGKGSHAAIRAHIMRQARRLGATDLIPDDWKAKKLDDSVFAHLDAATAFGKAIDFDEAQADGEQRELAQGLLDEVNEAVCALCTVLYEIAGDDAVTDKASAMHESLQQFGEHVKTIVPEGIETGIVAAALEQAGYRINAQGGIELGKGDHSDMYKEIAKRLGLAENASLDVIIKAMEAEEEKRKKAEQEAEKTAKAANALLKMSAKHKAYMDHPNAKMPKGGKEAFTEMEPAERDDHIKANPVEDDEEDEDVEKMIRKNAAFRTPQGVIVKRSEAGAMFDVMKAQNDQLAAQAAQIAKANDEAARGKIAKRAEPLSFIGKSDEVTDLVHSVSKLDPKLGEALLVKFEALNGVVEKSGLLNELGSGGTGQIGKAADTIQKKAEEIRKANPKLSIEKARDMARQMNPDLAKEEEEERQAKRKKAA